MAADVVENDDVASAQLQHEELLDVGAKDDPVCERACNFAPIGGVIGSQF